jgi:hypothetical protein
LDWDVVVSLSLSLVSRGGSRKNDLENRKTAIGAFFCTQKIRMETGLIIENGLKLKLASKKYLKIVIFR